MTKYKHYPLDIPASLHKVIKTYCHAKNFKLREFMPYILEKGFEAEIKKPEYTKVWIKKTIIRWKRIKARAYV